MIKRIKINPETEIKMLYDKLDVKESLIKNYMAEIEIQRQQLAIAVKALEVYHKGQIKDVEEVDGKDCIYTYPYSNDDGETAKQALQQIKDLEK